MPSSLYVTCNHYVFLYRFSLDSLRDLEYRAVLVKGIFDHDKEQYVGPRSLLAFGAETESRGLSSDPNVIGWHVVTPFKIIGGSHDGKVIMVNRGWVPQKKLDPATRANGQVVDPCTIAGLVRNTETRQAFAQKSTKKSNKWQFRDIPAMAEQMAALPVFIDAALESTVEGGPIGGQTKVALRNEHLQYMVTWYSLAALTLYLWVKKIHLK